MDSAGLENCIIAIKQAIARIEEQTKIIAANYAEHKLWSERLHDEQFAKIEDLRKETAEVHRCLDVRVSKHDVAIQTIQQSLAGMEATLQQISQGIARSKGIAVGLGMAGGAVVSALTLLLNMLQ